MHDSIVVCAVHEFAPPCVRACAANTARATGRVTDGGGIATGACFVLAVRFAVGVGVGVGSGTGTGVPLGAAGRMWISALPSAEKSGRGIGRR